MSPHRLSYAEYEALCLAQYTRAMWCLVCDADVPETEAEAIAAGWEIDNDGAPDGYDTATCPQCRGVSL